MSQLGIEHHHRAIQRLTELSQWYNEVVEQFNFFTLKPTIEQYNELTALLPRFKRNTQALKQYPALKPELQNAFSHFISRCEQSLLEGKSRLNERTQSIDVSVSETTTQNEIKKEFKQIATRCGCNWSEQGNSLTISRKQDKLTVTPKENGLTLQGSNSLGIEMLEQWCHNHGWNKRDLKLRIIMPHDIKPNSLEGMAALATFKEYTRNGFLVQNFPLALFRHATKMSDKEFHELNWNYLSLQDERASLQYC